jgi:hypothetical protein
VLILGQIDPMVLRGLHLLLQHLRVKENKFTCVTPRVTNHQGSVKHVPTNTKKHKAIQIQLEIEKFKFCHRGHDDPIQEFWRFYEAELVLAHKT